MQVRRGPLALDLKRFPLDQDRHNIAPWHHRINGDLPPVQPALPAALHSNQFEPVTLPVDQHFVHHEMSYRKPSSRPACFHCDAMAASSFVPPAAPLSAVLGSSNANNPAAIAASSAPLPST